MRMLYWVTLLIAIIGSLNWGLVALANFNIVSYLFGEDTDLTRVIYTIVGTAGFYLLMHSVGNIAKKLIH